MSEEESRHKTRNAVTGEILDEISEQLDAGNYPAVKVLAVAYRLISGGAQPGTSIVDSK